MRSKNYSRRNFLMGSASLGAGLILFSKSALAQKTERPPAIDPKIVNEYVKLAHSDFDRTKELLEEHPLLLNAAWDWGGGDFETAIGAAGHMGHRDFAEYLIGKGARYDIFVSTMLGHTELVKSTIEMYPHLLNSLGPHGFTLLHHAEKGGNESKALYEYLLSKGLDRKFVKLY